MEECSLDNRGKRKGPVCTDDKQQVDSDTKQVHSKNSSLEEEGKIIAKTRTVGQSLQDSSSVRERRNPYPKLK